MLEPAKSRFVFVCSSSLLGGKCYFNTSLCLPQDNINHCYSICCDHSEENLLYVSFMLVIQYIFIDFHHCSLSVTHACNLDYLQTPSNSAVLSSLRPDLGLCPALSVTHAVPLFPSPPPHHALISVGP